MDFILKPLEMLDNISFIENSQTQCGTNCGTYCSFKCSIFELHLG
jgi:hypothetical protein